MKIRIPAVKKRIPTAVRMKTGMITSLNPAPSMKTLRNPSAIMVSGNVRIAGMLHSGKL